MQLIGWTRIIARLAGRVGVERRPSLGPSGPESGWALQISKQTHKQNTSSSWTGLQQWRLHPFENPHVRYGGPPFPGKPPHHFRDLCTGIVYITHIYISFYIITNDSTDSETQGVALQHLFAEILDSRRPNALVGCFAANLTPRMMHRARGRLRRS